MKTNVLILLSAFFLFISFNSCKKTEGCTTPGAINYDPDADINDGSCVFNGAVKFLFSPQVSCGEVSIRIDGSLVYTTVQSASTTTLFISLAPGNYNWSVADGCDSWNGSVTIKSDETIEESLSR